MRIGMAPDADTLIGRRVHIYQPQPLTSRRHIWGVVDHVLVSDGGFDTYVLRDAESARPGEDREPASLTGRWVHRHSLNWTIEVLDGAA